MAVAGLALAACSGDADELVRAQEILHDRDRFETAVEAGEALAEVADRLVSDAQSCEDDCDPRFEAAAYARVLALRVLGCTAPGREAARTAMLEHVEALRDGSKHPPAPAVPDCPGPT
ncbi:MAG TPA: hypothetical protein VFU93_03785 [Acidimicrobiales bacterium]|nr:hypothetical protein [Acidimicrobiales bacterium]